MAALLTIAALGGLLAVLYFRPAAERPEMRVEMNTRSSPGGSFALSPDGRRLVFAAADDRPRRLWLQALDAVTVLPLPGTEGAMYPFWSPNSRSVAFFAGTKLMRLDIGSGLPRQLATVVRGSGGSWNRNGVILFARSGIEHLWQVSDSGGQEVPATKPDLPRLKAGALDRGVPAELFKTRIAGGGRPVTINFNYDVAADGRFLINVVTAEVPASPLTLLLNWRPRP